MYHFPSHLLILCLLSVPVLSCFADGEVASPPTADSSETEWDEPHTADALIRRAVVTSTVTMIDCKTPNSITPRHSSNVIPSILSGKKTTATGGSATPPRAISVSTGLSYGGVSPTVVTTTVIRDHNHTLPPLPAPPIVTREISVPYPFTLTPLNRISTVAAPGPSNTMPYQPETCENNSWYEVDEENIRVRCYIQVCKLGRESRQDVERVPKYQLLELYSEKSGRIYLTLLYAQ